MATEHFQRGQIIFREGDKSQEAYFIVSGLIEISINTSHGTQSLAKMGPGEIFGEMGMIMDRPRSATATALENTTVETIADNEFDQQIIQRPDRLHVYLATLFERIRKTDLLLSSTTNATVPLTPKAKPAKEPVYRVKLRSDATKPAVSITNRWTKRSRNCPSGSAAPILTPPCHRSRATISRLKKNIPTSSRATTVRSTTSTATSFSVTAAASLAPGWTARTSVSMPVASPAS
jgi:hypothetical protein